MSLARRAAGEELMDQPVLNPRELTRALRDLQGVNRWLGGRRVILHHMGAMLRRLPAARYRVLDVATGSADIPLALARWARQRRPHLDIVATDLHPQTLEVARAQTADEPAICIERADALTLSYEDNAFDFALCSTALHHFEENDAIRVLRELDRVARYGVVVNDLRRSAPALLGARLLAATVWRRSEFTRHDGPLSVRRAFTPAELRHLADQAGLANATVHTHFPFRLALVVDRT